MLVHCASFKYASRTYMHLLSVVASLNAFQNGGRRSPSVSPHQLYILVSLMPMIAGALLGMVASSAWHGCCGPYFWYCSWNAAATDADTISSRCCLDTVPLLSGMLCTGGVLSSLISIVGGCCVIW